MLRGQVLFYCIYLMNRRLDVGINIEIFEHTFMKKK